MNILSLSFLSLAGFGILGVLSDLHPDLGNLDDRVQFTEATEFSGIRFKHGDGRSGQKYMLETVGSGAAFFDYDNDGDIDLYIVNGADLPGSLAEISLQNALYRNDGDGKFTEVTFLAGVGHKGYGVGCTAADYDNDGYQDLYVTNYGPNVLYHNNGDGTFTDITTKAGVGDERWGSSCAFLDYDNDSDLDLYVVNYLDFSLDNNPWCGVKNIRAYCNPELFAGVSDRLYRNNSDGTFTDVTLQAGVFFQARGLGITTGDYDNDGDIDLYIANDMDKNYLFENNGDGTFTDVTSRAGVGFSEDGVPESGMGTAFGDYNNDGYLDLTVSNSQNQTNTLYKNERNGFFTDLTFASGIGEKTLSYVGWGIEFIDYDNDGWQDIFVANGHMQENIEQYDQTTTYAQQNQLFKNCGAGTFRDVSATTGSGMWLKKVSRGAAFGDYDNDGDIDIFINNSNQTADLLRNDGGNKNNWLMLQTVGVRSNRDGIGARIKVVSRGAACCAPTMQVKEVKSGSSYLSQSDKRVLFGLKDRSKVDLIEVRWPSGLVEKIKDIKANQLLRMVEGHGIQN